MTDRELLELAAKAAGLLVKGEWVGSDDKMIGIVVSDGIGKPKYRWAPLTDDGDALRLAVKLGLIVDCSRPSAGEPYKQHAIWIGDTVDNGTLTRRAIVLAAAAIAKEAKT